MSRGLLAFGAMALMACSSTEPPPITNATATATPVDPKPATSSAPSAAATESASAEPSVEPLAPSPVISVEEALDITFPVGAPAETAQCVSSAANDKGAIRCLLGVRFSGDAASRDLAVDLFDKLGTVTGVIREHDMDGGWRGQLHLVPELPIGRYKKHLQWVKSGFEEIDAFFAALDARRPAKTRSTYRYRALALRFFRSVGRTTPSAYATGWEVSYNVSGSLHANAAAVRDTLFHEIFHSNDADHGQWSSKKLTSLVDGILAKCGQKTACLTPYAPGTTMVRGGTYYAFQKGNGVWEYAAELAGRYFEEHRHILAGEKLKKKPFKCGPQENAKAWTALVDGFFGVDLVPPCE